MVLLVVDAQKAIVNDRLYRYDLFVSNVREMIETARRNDIEVIYIRHDDGPGCELTKGNDGYEIYEALKPADGEKIFDKSRNSAFLNTGLLEYLMQKNESTVIIVGLQTEYCIDATIKAGFEHGFRMIVPENTNSTFDNRFMSSETTCKYYNEFIWNGRYAECIPFDKATEMMNGDADTSK
ncbi:MAG: cysteine hydrolase [Ruminococcus sp.]|nr:cysteine hydrolase [Ruminococcus sp.]